MLIELWSFVGLDFQVIILHYMEEFDTVFIQKIALNVGLNPFTTNH